MDSVWTWIGILLHFEIIKFYFIATSLDYLELPQEMSCLSSLLFCNSWILIYNMIWSLIARLYFSALHTKKVSLFLFILNQIANKKIEEFLIKQYHCQLKYSFFLLRILRCGTSVTVLLLERCQLAALSTADSWQRPMWKRYGSLWHYHSMCIWY